MDSLTDVRALRTSAGRPRILPLVGAVIALVIGLLMIIASIGQSPAVLVLGVLTLGLGLLSAATQILRWTNAPRSAGSAVAGSTPDGLPMLVVAASRTTMFLAVAAMVLVAACLAAWAALASAAGNWLVAALLAVAALGTLAYLVVPVARGLRSARVELTPEWLATERYGARWQLPWSAVGGAVPPVTQGGPLAVTLHGTTSPPRASGWPGWYKLPDAPQGVVAIPVQELPVHPESLARVIALCATDADLRAQIGTPASTDWSRWPAGPGQPRP
ncbi:MAG: hypothetical protein JWR20_1827 [Marmoricola sp.]|nr:hypothetical protein [Marmoricola sp.]